MTFIDFLKALEVRLGYHQLPIRADAGDIRDIFEASPVHTDLATRIVRAMYRENGCQKMQSPVTLNACNAALIPVRVDLLKARTTDVDEFGFMDDLCHAVSDLLGEPATAVRSKTCNAGEQNTVIPFPSRKLKSWA